MTNAPEAAVNSDSVMQLVPEMISAELSNSLVSDSSFVARSDHQLDTSPDTLDVTSSEVRSNEVQKDSEMTYSEDAEDVQNKVVTDSAVDKDTEDSQSTAQTDINIDVEYAVGQTKPTCESDLDKATENGENKPSRDEYRDVDETGAATQLNGVQEAVIDSEVLADDELNEEQFLSPAASEVDIAGTMSPPEEIPAAELKDAENAARSTDWSTKVPLLDMEPPAMDSDYEEAVLCEMDEAVSASETVESNSYRVKDDTDDALRQNEDGHRTSPETTSTVKPTPM